MTTTKTRVNASSSILRPNAPPMNDIRCVFKMPVSKLLPFGMPRSHTQYACRSGVECSGSNFEAKKRKLPDKATNMTTSPNTSRRRTKAPIPHIIFAPGAERKVRAGEEGGGAEGPSDPPRRPRNPAVRPRPPGWRTWVNLQPVRPVAAYLRSPRPAPAAPGLRALELGALVNAFGNGVVLPFLLIYLHNVRGIPFGLAGTAAAVQWTVALASGFLGGTLSDRPGGRNRYAGHRGQNR